MYDEIMGYFKCEVIDYLLSSTGEITKHWQNKDNCSPTTKVRELHIQEAQFYNTSCASKWHCRVL